MVLACDIRKKERSCMFNCDVIYSIHDVIKMDFTMWNNVMVNIAGVLIGMVRWWEEQEQKGILIVVSTENTKLESFHVYTDPAVWMYYCDI